MKTNELLRLLRKDGWFVVRQKGSHASMRHPTKRNILTVPVHPGKEVPGGTCHAILKAAGLK